MMSMIILIVILSIAFKGCGLILKLFGKLIGMCFSAIGFLIIASLAVAVLNIAIVVVPIILIIGVIAIASACVTV